MNRGKKEEGKRKRENLSTTESTEEHREQKQKNIKLYEISIQGDVIMVEIDHDMMTDEELHAINDFSKWRLAISDGNITHAVLRMLGKIVYKEQIYHNWSRHGIWSVFDYENKRGKEGWPKMDGSEGIKITDVPAFDIEDVYVREVEWSGDEDDEEVF